MSNAEWNTQIPADPEKRLEEARAAWLSLVNAEAEMRRLDGYRRKTQGMREDSARHFRVAHNARVRLSQLLDPPRKPGAAP